MAIDINIGSKLDAKGFKQAETALDKLNKGSKNLARSLGYAFGSAAIIRYGKNAVKAFADDERAAKSLTLTLNNLGMAFADPQVKRFISDLESQFGVLDDLLRPAYQKLVTTTGDYKKAQDLLKTSLDLAALSGKDVVETSSDLAKAYAGNTKGIIKYGLGLSKTEIQAMSFEEILARIAEVSKGQAEAAADSYAGALGRLQVATANASESIGKDLITALTTLGGEGGLPKTLSLIESIASAVGDATIGLSRLIRNIGILASGNPIQSIKDLRAATARDKAIDRKDRAVYGGIYATQYQTQAAKSSKTTPIAAAQTKATKALTKATQDQLKLAKAKAIFDLQKIQIEAALKGKISEEDRIRLKLMQAIEDENITQIEKYTKLLDQAQVKTLELVNTLSKLKFPDLQVPTILQPNGKEFSSFTSLAAQTNIQPNLKEWSSSFSPSAMLPTAPVPAPTAPTVVVNVGGSVIAENELAQTINNAIANSNWAGSAVGYNRQAVTTAV